MTLASRFMFDLLDGFAHLERKPAQDALAH
jgi:hypothetical protein